jgi:hypothetical protein
LVLTGYDCLAFYSFLTFAILVSTGSLWLFTIQKLYNHENIDYIGNPLRSSLDFRGFLFFRRRGNLPMAFQFYED